MKPMRHKKTACSSTFSGVLLVAQHILLIFLSSFCVLYFFPLTTIWPVLFYLFVVVFIGSRMRALGNIVHECAHNTFVPSKLSNELIGKILCQIEFSCFERYRKDHFAHHRYLGNEQKDPDFKTYLEIRSSIPYFFMPKKKNGIRWSIFYSACFPLNWLKMCKKSICIGSKSNLIFHLVYLCFLVIFSLAFGYQAFFYFFVVPFLSSYQALKIFSDMMDHDGVYFFPDMRYKSCNHLFSVPILNWVFFPRNDAYHLVHHLFPREPITAFKRLHQKLLKEDEVYSKQKHVIL